jgi:hypothetical protein
MPKWDRYIVIGDGGEYSYLFCAEHCAEGEELASWVAHAEMSVATLVAACAVHELSHHREAPSAKEGS